ncbi:hypothetical protein [Helicobacter trogontum]|uniref:Uncharacterized protein n=1 Tax=Helicobacter trogontum TaxID=50960 RepID=A0A4U8S225_9HELI|nr:hypothetical protein [Helicobacter trogontum]TLD79753.1 hypothetical protein LS81_010280 [Helicobacter trogontum]
MNKIVMLILMICSISFADSYKNNVGDRYITTQLDKDAGVLWLMFSITKANKESNTGHEYLMGGYASHKKESSTNKTSLKFNATAYFDENEQCRIKLDVESKAYKWIKILINNDKCDKLGIPNGTIFYKQ